MAIITAININLDVENQSYNLRIPRLVKVEELKEILRDALSVFQVTLPRHFDLHVRNKAVLLDDIVLLSHYPLSDGDELQVIERTTSHA